MSKVSINVHSLRAADIILSTTGAGSSGAIRQSIGSDVSHAGIVIGNGDVVEAVTSGVRVKPYSTAYVDATLLIVLRRRNMNDAQRAAVVNTAKNFDKRPYDSVGAAGSGISNNRGKALAIGGTLLTLLGAGATTSAVIQNANDKNKDSAFFCSELVARAFEIAGVPIVAGNPSYANPRTLRTASTLIYIGHLSL